MATRFAWIMHCINILIYLSIEAVQLAGDTDLSYRRNLSALWRVFFYFRPDACKQLYTDAAFFAFHPLPFVRNCYPKCTNKVPHDYKMWLK